jgi:hypothetical protein
MIIEGYIRASTKKGRRLKAVVEIGPHGRYFQVFWRGWSVFVVRVLDPYERSVPDSFPLKRGIPGLLTWQFGVNKKALSEVFGYERT